MHETTSIDLIDALMSLQDDMGAEEARQTVTAWMPAEWDDRPLFWR